MQEDLIDILLVPEVGGEHIILERQFTDKKLKDMYQRLYHLRFVEMHIVDGFLYLPEDAAELLCLALRELVDGVELRGDARDLHISSEVGGGYAVVEHPVDEQPLGDRIGREMTLGGLVRREDKERAVIQMMLAPGNVNISIAAEDELHLITTDTVVHDT